MRGTTLLIIGVLIVSTIHAQNYNVALIADSLKKGASVVKRYEELRIEQKSAGRAIFYNKYAYTIYDEEGLRYARLVESYDKFKEINHIEGTLYNSEGKKLRSVKKKDISDVSTRSDNLMDDIRVKVHDFGYFDFPFTVEYEIESESDGLLGLPTWNPVDQKGIAVENAKLVITSTVESPIRYKQRNFVQEPVVIEKNGRTTLTWELKNVPPIIPEPYMPFWRDVAPSILLGPSMFKASKYSGNMSSWTEYGKYIYDLIKGRDVLPEAIKQEIRGLTANLATDLEKIDAVYSYMQKNTRYISVQLGIGGWQPFEASYVATKRYGDCKALSNYTIALLKEIGIKAAYVEIASGTSVPLLEEDFPSSQFNHVVACVPMQNDTIWLECTDPTRAMGYMGRSTGNRKAVLINENGGFVVNTPVYSADMNLQLRKFKGVIDDNGNLKGNVHTVYTGEQQELPSFLIHGATPEEKQKYLNQMFELPTYQVVKFEYKETKSRVPKVEEVLEMNAAHYASVSGKRIFITPNLFSRMGAKLSAETPRKYDIKLDRSYRDVDSIELTVPLGYILESLPKEKSLKAPWGTYSISYSYTDGKVMLIRTEERYAGLYSSAQYSEFCNYLESIFKADRSKIVLVKKE